MGVTSGMPPPNLKLTQNFFGLFLWKCEGIKSVTDESANNRTLVCPSPSNFNGWWSNKVCFLSLAWSKLGLCLANHGAGYFSNLACDWLSIVWAYSELRLCSVNHRAGHFSNLACDWLSIVWAYSRQETENGPRSARGRSEEPHTLFVILVISYGVVQYTIMVITKHVFIGQGQ